MIVNSLFDGSVVMISGGLYVINMGVIICFGQDDEWEIIINGGLLVINNIIMFIIINGLVDCFVVNQDMDFMKFWLIGNGVIKGLLSVMVDFLLINV